MTAGSACIFVDGENLRHSLVELFRQEFNPADYLPKSTDWTGFFNALVQQAGATSRLRAYWYVVEAIDFWPWGLARLSSDIVKLQRVLHQDKKCAYDLTALGTSAQKEGYARQKLHDLVVRERRMKNRFDGWKVFQDGITSRFDAIEFRRAGAITYNLFTQQLGREKAVDVKLATDLLEFRDIYDVGIIVSGDQDYVPAVQAAKDSGKQMVNVSFLKRDGQILPGGARRLNQTTDRTVEMRYSDLLKFMRFRVLTQATSP
jgi:uncharacterized LabA/DUF88 family protein